MTATVASQRSDSFAELTRINSDDLLKALGLGELRRGRALLERALRRTARRLARQVLLYDDLVASAGLRVAAAWALGQYVRSVAFDGVETLPGSGPLLFASNHPGLYDTVALFAAIPRCDLRVLAAERPFLRALANTSRYLIPVGESATERSAAIRAATRHLRAGGALLTFPGGRIEPDPAVLPGAVEALQSWSESLGVWARLVPDLTVVPVVVSGVLSPAALRNPLSRLRGPEHHALLAATLQVLFPSLQRGTVRVSFGRSLAAGHLGDALGEAVAAESRRLMSRGGRGDR